MRLFAAFLAFFAFYSFAYSSDVFTVCRNNLNKPILDHQTTLDTILVTLKVYDALGRETIALLDKFLLPGTYGIEWDASIFPSGVYYYRLETPYFRETKKMLLIK